MTFSQRPASMFSCGILVLAFGCGGDAEDAPGNPTEPATPALTESESPTTTEPGDAATVEDTGEMSAAHILIAYAGSSRASDEVTRSKEEALALAQEIATKARAEGADFAELAKEYSDGPSGPNGGDLGNFYPEQMVGPFAEATQALAIGNVSDPVETEFGYHVIRRQPVKVIPKASAKHILVMYAGSLRAPTSITRTKEEALARMQECLKRAQEGESFEELAREYSDGPTGPRGGDLGEFPQGMMAPAFDEAVFACEVGEMTDIVETPFGFHIIYRYK